MWASEAYGGIRSIPCPDYGDSTPSYPAVIVLIRNCSSGPVPVAGIVDVRQSGRDLDRAVPHQVLVSTCDHDGAERREEPLIPPGECGVVRIDTLGDLTKVDSTLTYSFNGDLGSWPSLTNPFELQLDFGRWGTTVNTNTGRMDHQCVFDR